MANEKEVFDILRGNQTEGALDRLADAIVARQAVRCCFCGEDEASCGGMEGHEDDHTCNTSVPGIGSAVGPEGCEVCRSFEE